LHCESERTDPPNKSAQLRREGGGVAHEAIVVFRRGGYAEARMGQRGGDVPAGSGSWAIHKSATGEGAGHPPARPELLCAFLVQQFRWAQCERSRLAAVFLKKILHGCLGPRPRLTHGPRLACGPRIEVGSHPAGITLIPADVIFLRSPQPQQLVQLHTALRIVVRVLLAIHLDATGGAGRMGEGVSAKQEARRSVGRTSYSRSSSPLVILATRLAPVAMRG
jgi:hypothetical protein